MSQKATFEQAESDAPTRRSPPRMRPFEELLHAVLDLHEPGYWAKGVRLVRRVPAGERTFVPGASQALLAALSRLLSLTLARTPAWGAVVVRLAREGTRLRVEISGSAGDAENAALLEDMEPSRAVVADHGGALHGE